MFRYEEQLNKIDGTLATIEFQREALENANTNTEVLRNMGYAAKALEGAHKQVGDVDKVSFPVILVLVLLLHVVISVDQLFTCLLS